MTLANRITIGRFALTVVYFVLLGISGTTRREGDPTLLYAAFFLFLACVVGDGLDGHFARKYGQETHFGRIADPFADKILICGSFVFFLEIDSLSRLMPAWMAVVILAREFLVTGIRSAAEAQGIPFAASGWGKAKMVVQSAVCGTAVFYAAWLSGIPWCGRVLRVLLWITVAVTALSAVSYVLEARRLFRARGV